MHSKNIRFMVLFLLPLLVGCATQKKHSLPKDLMHNGKPIHPSQVVATQFGDSSRFEPKSVELDLFNLMDPQLGDEWFRPIDQKLSYDNKTKTVTFKVNYTHPYGEDTREDIMCDRYHYIGSYNDTHIILASSYDTSATGRFSFLSLIKRVGDTIINAGEITAGDRGHGGCIHIISHEENILRYSQTATPDTVIYEFINQSVGIFFPPMISGVSLVHEVDLDSVKHKEYTSKVVGLIFDQDNYTMDDYPCFWEEGTAQYKLDQIERCFCSVADTYVKQSKKELTLTEAQTFAQEVIQCIQKIIPT